MSIGLSLEEFDETLRMVLESGGEFTIHPRGTSMLPLIVQGRDSVVLAAADRKLRKNDIALYIRTNGQYVLHRVISVDNGSYTMCGDAGLSPERGIRRDQIVAVVCRLNRCGKPLELTSPVYRLYVTLWSSFTVRRLWHIARRIKHRLARIIMPKKN